MDKHERTEWLKHLNERDQGFVDAIKADLSNPDYVATLSYYDEMMASDEIAFLEMSIARRNEELNGEAQS